MAFWTVMWITMLSDPFEFATSYVVYPSLAACEAALLTVGGTIPYDHNILCEETTALSASIRPKRRPEGLGE